MTVSPPPSVLIVDDNAANRLAMTAVVEPLKLKTITAASGDEALRHLTREDVACILLDVQMPGLDGFETAALIKQRDKHAATPIIFLTGVERTEVQFIKAYAHGAVDYIVKPIAPEILLSKVRFFVEAYKARRSLEEEASRQRQRANEQEQLAEEFRAQLAAIVSHDLRNPLAAILTGAQLILSDNSPELAYEVAQRILAAGNRAQRLIDNVLELTRLNNGRPLTLRRTSLDLHGLVEELVDEFRISYGPDCVDLRRSGDTTGSWDEVRLAQIITNLTANALQHRHRQTSVIVETRGEGDDVMLRVSNQGRAIPEEVMAHLFEPPQRKPQVVAVKRNGTGLGLFIVGQLIRAHGGRISVSSDPEQGTCFTVVLPRQVAQPLAGATAS